MIRTPRLLAVLALATSTLAACDQPGREPAPSPSAPAAPAFASSLGGDVSGYYLPTQPVTAGNWLVKDIFLGQTEDFRAWEAGQRPGTFAPVMIELEDQTSPMTATEMGEVRSGQLRVLPTRYQVSDDRVTFEGTGEGVGPVRFEGRLDQDALATARRNLGGDEAPVLTGRLSLGGQSRDVRLRWWAGD